MKQQILWVTARLMLVLIAFVSLQMINRASAQENGPAAAHTLLKQYADIFLEQSRNDLSTVEQTDLAHRQQACNTYRPKVLKRLSDVAWLQKTTEIMRDLEPELQGVLNETVSYLSSSIDGLRDDILVLCPNSADNGAESWRPYNDDELFDLWHIVYRGGGGSIDPRGYDVMRAVLNEEPSLKFPSELPLPQDPIPPPVPPTIPRVEFPSFPNGLENEFERWFNDAFDYIQENLVPYNMPAP